MLPSQRQRLTRLVDRLAELDALLGSAEAVRDLENFRRLSKERAEIGETVALFTAYCQAENDLAAARAMEAEAELAAFAREEAQAAQQKLAELELELQRALLPKDPDDEKNVFLEIRAGTGGEESALFAADLFRMYARFAERQGWRVEVVSKNESDLGGFREIIARIEGEGVFGKLKFESGGHRVQRVPETEAQGRIHTSACTVAVLPEAGELAEIDLNPADLKIDTFRASGAGGQHINKTDSAVRVTHLPTGLVVECQDDRSQHRNKAQALAVLAARLKDMQEREKQQQIATTRKSLIGSGDRSERIRTYNFPQGRVTDHRINLTLYKLDAVMDGDLDELIGALQAEHQTERLAALASES
ncbi:MAG: peptide chain release factor 1 [Rhodocyclaceae bacterium]|nr:peptide chain release factor 1 [Rhodocyclaceae bacterium]